MQAFAYYDGVIAPWEQTRISLSDRSVFFADAVYDAALAANGFIAFEKEHTDRFFKNAAALDIPAPVSRDEFSAILQNMLSLANGEPCFLYYQLARSSPARTHVYGNERAGHLLITVSPTALPDTRKTLSLIGVADERYGYCHIKTVGLLPNVLAAQTAARQGADEAVFVRRGKVTECSHSNIFLLQDGVLYTHPANRRILDGIGRRHLIKLAKEVGIRVAERAFSPAALRAADDVLITSTSKLCMRAVSFDGRNIGRDTALARTLCRRSEEEFFGAVSLPCPTVENDGKR